MPLKENHLAALQGLNNNLMNRDLFCIESLVKSESNNKKIFIFITSFGWKKKKRFVEDK